MGAPLTNLGLSARAATDMPVLRAEAYTAPFPGFCPASAQWVSIRVYLGRTPVKGFPFTSVPRIHHQPVRSEGNFRPGSWLRQGFFYCTPAPLCVSHSWWKLTQELGQEGGVYA